MLTCIYTCTCTRTVSGQVDGHTLLLLLLHGNHLLLCWLGWVVLSVVLGGGHGGSRVVGSHRESLEPVTSRRELLKVIQVKGQVKVCWGHDPGGNTTVWSVVSCAWVGIAHPTVRGVVARACHRSMGCVVASVGVGVRGWEVGDGVRYHGPVAHSITCSKVARVGGTGKVQGLERGKGEWRGERGREVYKWTGEREREKQ